MAKTIPMMRSAYRRMYDWAHVRNIVFAASGGSAAREKSCDNLRRYAVRTLRTRPRPKWAKRLPGNRP